MRRWSLPGLILGVVVLGVVVAITAQTPLMFLNAPGFALVLGGSIAATLTSYSLREIWAALRAVAVATTEQDQEDREGLRDILKTARLLDTQGVQGADEAASKVRSPFVRTGLQLVIDDAPTSQLVDVLDWRIGRLRAHGDAQADVFNVMAVYAPGFGMIGTLLGLVDMLREVGGPIDEIGASLAIALVTTFYGIVLANAVFKPLAISLRRRTQNRMAVLSVAKEALVLLNGNHGPMQLKYSLDPFIDPDEPDLVGPFASAPAGAAAHG